MTYSADEIRSAINELIGAAASTRAQVGHREDTKMSFVRVQQSARGVFLTHFNAPFYVVFLGARRLAELLDSQADLVSEIIDSIHATGRTVGPINDLQPLENAVSALNELHTALSRRSSGFAEIGRVPAFRRYVQNLDSFLETHGGAIKQGGSIVQTPEQARAALPALLGRFRVAHEELVRRATLLRDALGDFNSLDLSRVVAESVVARAREQLGTRLEALSQLDDTARLQQLRDTVLELIAQKTVVRSAGSGSKPSPYYAVTGALAAFSDDSHPATAARLEADIPGPYNILEGENALELTVDGARSVRLSLPLSFVAELRGRTVEPYVIDDSNSALTSEVGDETFAIALTKGTRSASEISAEVNAVLAPTDVRLRPVFFPLKLDTLAHMERDGDSSARFRLIAGSLGQLGIRIGDQVEIVTGPNQGTTWSVTAVDIDLGVLEASGSASVVADSAARIQVGPAARALLLADENARASLGSRRAVRITPESGAPADHGASVLGFAPAMISRSRPTTARELVDFVNASTTEVRAELVFDEVFVGIGTTSLTNPVLVTLDASAPLGHDFGWVLEITGGPNRGRYLVTEPADVADPFGVQIDRVLPVLRVGSEPVSFPVRLLRERVVLASAETTVASGVRVEGGAGAALLFQSVPKSARGTTRFVRLPKMSRAVVPGDVLELYEDRYNAVSRSFAIVAVEQSAGVLELEAEIESTTSFTFGNGTSPAPFARLRVGRVAKYDLFRERLERWLGRSENQASYFQELSRLVTSLMVNRAPADAAVGDAARAAERYAAVLTRAGADTFGGSVVPNVSVEDTLEFALGDYRVDPVDAVEQLLRAFRERGADRALDILLEGRFSEFFGIGEDGVSYGAELAARIRDVAREDLAVSRVGREVGRQVVIAEVGEEDVNPSRGLK